MFEQLNFRVNFNNADYTELCFAPEDRRILQELARQVAEIAGWPKMAQRKQLWLRHNSLQPTVPVLLCDPENGWNELIPEKAIQCQNSIARHWECHLRKQLFWGREMNDDYVVEPFFNLPHLYSETAWRMADDGRTATGKAYRKDGGAYHIDTILEEYDRMNRLQPPEIQIDYSRTNTLLEMAHDLFDGILDVRLNTVWFWSVGITDDLVFLRGMEKLMVDFVDEPEKVHEIMKLLLRHTMDRLDFLESSRLLSLNNDGTYVGSGGMGFTGELPVRTPGEPVMTGDMWGLAESQVTVGISPDMFREFIFPYQKQLMERFGLTCYGCCEPMDARFDIVKSVSNLRRVSVSPWADRRIMAEKLRDQYIYSLKHSPSPLAMPVMEEEPVRKDIREALRLTRDSRLEIIMKDNHTLGNNPDNLKNWVRIVREEIASL